MRVWKFQRPEDREKFGDKAPWTVGWYDPRGGRCKKKIGAKSLAEKFRRRKEAELALGLCEPRKRTKWVAFYGQFLEVSRAGRSPKTVEAYKASLDAFQRLMKPAYVDSITTAVVDRFIAKRLRDRQRAPATLLRDRKRSTAGEAAKVLPDLSPASVNKDLRSVKRALRKAKEWGMIPEVPVITFLREPDHDPEFIDDETFAKLHDACGVMKRPQGPNYDPPEWWRALFTFAYMTGWRIGQILALERDNLDFAKGVAFVPADKTKGRRDATVELPAVVLEHLKTVVGFGPLVFDWPYHERTLWADFEKLRDAAGVDISGAFHRFRFGFANANVDHLSESALKHLMGHRSYSTTRKYINQVHQIRREGVAERVHVPDVLKTSAG